MMENISDQESLEHAHNPNEIQHDITILKNASLMHSNQSSQVVIRKSNAIYYYLYFTILFSIFFLFYINYLKTNNAYEENITYINLKSSTICNSYIHDLSKCLNNTVTNNKNASKLIKVNNNTYQYDTSKICKLENDKMQLCFDKVYFFSQKCQIYLNEFAQCKKNLFEKRDNLKNINDNKNNNNANGNENGKLFYQCLTQGLMNCHRAYPIVNISKVFDDL